VERIGGKRQEGKGGERRVKGGEDRGDSVSWFPVFLKNRALAPPNILMFTHLQKYEILKILSRTSSLISLYSV
jgi:hypothetical protein